MKRPISLAALLALALILFAGAAMAAPVSPAPAAGTACLSATIAPASPAQPPAPLFLADGKCASCPDLLKSCKAFCGSNNVTFNCQNSSPCAGTCSCTVAP